MSQLPMPYNPMLGTPEDLFPSVPQAQNPLHRAMSSPWAMMASTALNNVGAMSSGRQPQGNPLQAYQQSVAAQAAQRRQAQQEQRAQTEHDRRMDPFFEFEEAKRRGHVPDTMTYAEWLNISRSTTDTAPMKNFAARRALEAQLEAAETPEQKAAIQKQIDTFDNYVRSQSIYGGGGGSQYIRMPDGSIRELVSAETATGREGTLAGTKESATGEARSKLDEYQYGLDMYKTAQTMYPKAQDTLEQTKRWLGQFQEGQESIDTGFVPGIMFNMFGIGPEELGELNAQSISQTLENLNITNLAPVTEREFAEVMNLWANISKSPSVNRGTLTEALRRTEFLMALLEKDMVRGMGVVETYGTPRQVEYFNQTYGSEAFQPTTDEKDDIDI